MVPPECAVAGAPGQDGAAVGDDLSRDIHSRVCTFGARMAVDRPTHSRFDCRTTSAGVDEAADSKIAAMWLEQNRTSPSADRLTIPSLGQERDGQANRHRSRRFADLEGSGGAADRCAISGRGRGSSAGVQGAGECHGGGAVDRDVSGVSSLSRARRGAGCGTAARP